MYQNGSGKWAYSYQDDGGNWLPTNIVTDLNRHSFLLDGYNKQVNFDNGKFINTLSNYTATKESDKNILIFNNGRAIHWSAFIGHISNMKLYEFKMWNSGELIIDFKPCTNSNGEVGLYDIVNDEFYNNSGTGRFVAGPEKEEN